jgi:hypothetical protein
MKLFGQRRDGALHVSIGGGMSVILRGDRHSPPIDSSLVDQKYGPWIPASPDLEQRRAVEKQLDRAHVVSLVVINAAMSFDEMRDRVSIALRARLGLPTSPYPYGGPSGMELFIPQNGLGEDWVVYCSNGKHFGLGYSIGADGTVSFDGDAEEVRASWEGLSGDAEAEYDFAADKDERYIECKKSEWFKKFMASKKKNMTVELPGSLPDLNKTPGTV